MATYIIVDCFIIVIGIICGGYKCFNFNKNSGSNSKFYYLLIGAVLIVISGLRGNFAVDYDNYVSLFYRYDGWTLEKILSKNFFGYPETGYLVLQYLLKVLWNNPVVIFVSTSVIIVHANLKVVKEYFSFGILPVLLFVEMGNFYASFNIMRQILAVSIILLGSNYLYKRQFWKYCIIVFVAFTIHKSSLIMLPFYFVLDRKFQKKGILVFSIATVFLSFFLPQIISLVQTYYWSWYSPEGYGMRGYSINNLVAPILMTIPALFIDFIYANKVSEYDVGCVDSDLEKITNIWRNSSFVFLLFSVLGMQVEMVQRISSFFSTYAIMYYSYIITSEKTGRYKQIIYAGTIIIVLVYGFWVKVNSAYNPYYFIFS